MAEQIRVPGSGLRTATRPPERSARSPTRARHCSTADLRSCEEDPVFVPLSVLEFRDRAATYFGDKVGVVDGDRSSPTAPAPSAPTGWPTRLRGLGVEPGDRVSFITYNTHHLLEAYYGVLEAGAVLNPVNIRLAPHEIAYILEHAGSRIVFFQRDFRAAGRGDRARALATAAPRGPRGRGGRRCERRVRGAHRRRLGRSATTRRSTRTRSPSCSTRAAPPGLPKGVAMTQRDLYLHALYAQLALGSHEDDVVLHVVPALPRERLGRPALPDDDRRAPRDAPQVRPGRRSWSTSSATG